MRKIALSLVMTLFALLVTAQNYSNLYIVGAALDCGWDAGKSFRMDKEADGVFTYFGPMKNGDFKFLLKTTPGDVWINCLNAKVENEKVTLDKEHDIVYVENSRVTGGDYKFMMDYTGVCKVTVDTKNMTMVITKSDLISASSRDGRGKRIVNLHSSSGKENDLSAYNLLLSKEESLQSTSNKWCYKGEEPWVIFSLPGIYSINKFGFRDGKIKETAANVYNIAEYKVYISTTGINEEDWTEIIHETDVEDQNEKLVKITPVEARYIKFVPVKNPADEYIRVYGVDIYGEYLRPLSQDIISTGKTVVDYHNSWSNRETPANILDGNKDAVDGVDANSPWAFAKGSTSGWAIIDLEDTYDITKFVLTDSEEWITGYKVYASSFVGKDSDWHLIGEGTFGKEQINKELTPTVPAQGRYLKLEIPAANQEGLTRVREFEVYGTPARKPGITTNHADLKAAYELALWTVDLNTTRDGILKAGARYDGKWTRDLSINVWNGYALLQPEIAKNSLQSLLMTNAEQLIGAEYWDKIIWVKGAYTYYLTTGDKDYLAQILKSGVNTLHELEAMKRDGNPVFDAEYGLFTGPSVFNDGIAGYEEPVFDGDSRGGAVVSHPAHNRIKCLSTNCIYYEACRLLAHIATELDNATVADEMQQKATNLRTNIRKHLFDEATGKLNYLIDQNGTVHPHQEGLGKSFAILFDIVTEEEAGTIIDETYVTPYGLPSVYPHFKRFSNDKPGRHNVMIWPFVNGFWADACLKAKRYDSFSFELFNLIDLGLYKGQDNFWEIYDPKDGKPDGGWQGHHWGGLEHQTWSATGFLNMVWYGLAGIQLEDGKMRFAPYLPEGINQLELTGLKYGDMILDISLEGEGNRIKEFRLNDVAMNEAVVDRTLTGRQSVSIVLEEDVVDIEQLVSTEEAPFTVFSEGGNIRVNINGGYRAESIELFDITGKLVESKKNISKITFIGKGLGGGVYTMKVRCNGGVYSEKVVR